MRCALGITQHTPAVTKTKCDFAECSNAPAACHCTFPLHHHHHQNLHVQHALLRGAPTRPQPPMAPPSHQPPHMQCLPLLPITRSQYAAALNCASHSCWHAEEITAEMSLQYPAAAAERTNHNACAQFTAVLRPPLAAQQGPRW